MKATRNETKVVSLLRSCQVQQSGVVVSVGKAWAEGRGAMDYSLPVRKVDRSQSVIQDLVEKERR